MHVKLISEEVERALAVGRKHHLTFRLIKLEEVLDEDNRFVIHDGDFHHKAWLFLPRNRDRSYVPPEADRRIKLLEAAGFEVVAQFVGHPEPDFQPVPEESQQPPSVEWQEMASVGITVATELISVLWDMAIGAIALILSVPAEMLKAIDPSLVCVIRCQSGFAFIEVCRWGES